MLILLLARAKIQIDVWQRVDKQTRATSFFRSIRIGVLENEKKQQVMQDFHLFDPLAQRLEMIKIDSLPSYLHQIIV